MNDGLSAYLQELLALTLIVGVLFGAGVAYLRTFIAKQFLLMENRLEEKMLARMRSMAKFLKKKIRESEERNHPKPKP